MATIGKPFNHGMPPEVEADPDLEALKCAAELVGLAQEGITLKVHQADELAICELLDEAERRLYRLIRRMEAREEQA